MNNVKNAEKKPSKRKRVDHRKKLKHTLDGGSYNALMNLKSRMNNKTKPENTKSNDE